MDTSRTLLVVAVVAMVALAGCSGGQPTSTAPTADGTTDPATSTGSDGGDGGDDNSLEGVDAAPWMTGDGVNATRLLSAHYGSLSGTSYRVETTQNSSGLLSLYRTGVQRVAENGDTIYEYDTRTSNGNSTTRAFVNDTWVLTENANATRTVYSDYRIEGNAESLNYTQQLVQYVHLGNFTVNRTYQVDGETRIEYVATGPSSVRGAQAITSFDGRFVVNPDGRLYELSIVAIQQAQYGNATTEFEFELAKVGGVDASTPAWVSTARQEATTVDFDYEYNGSVLKITHEGGDTVAAGTQLVMTPQEGRGVLFTSLPSDFSAGETIYVTAAGGRDLNVSDAPVPKPETGIGGPINLAMYGSNGEVVVRTGVGLTMNGTVGVVAPVGASGFAGNTAVPAI